MALETFRIDDVDIGHRDMRQVLSTMALKLEV